MHHPACTRFCFLVCLSCCCFQGGCLLVCLLGGVCFVSFLLFLPKYQCLSGYSFFFFFFSYLKCRKKQPMNAPALSVTQKRWRERRWDQQHSHDGHEPYSATPSTLWETTQLSSNQSTRQQLIVLNMLSRGGVACVHADTREESIDETASSMGHRQPRPGTLDAGDEDERYGVIIKGPSSQFRRKKANSLKRLSPQFQRGRSESITRTEL